MRLMHFENNSLQGPTKVETMSPHHAVLPSETQRRQAMNDWVKDTKGQKHVAERLDHVLDAFEAEFSWKGNRDRTGPLLDNRGWQGSTTCRHLDLQSASSP